MIVILQQIQGTPPTVRCPESVGAIITSVVTQNPLVHKFSGAIK